MKQPIYNADVERVVNPRAAERRRLKRRITVMLWIVVAAMAGILVNMVLWLLDMNSGIMTVMATEVLSVVAAFAAGRIWEVIKK